MNSDKLQQEDIISWIRNLQAIKIFTHRIEPDYYGEVDHHGKDYDNLDSSHCLVQFWEVEGYYPAEEMEFCISDFQGHCLIVMIPFDGISSPHVDFIDDKHKTRSSFEADLTIIDEIRNLIERFPDKFFHSHLQAANYYAHFDKPVQALEELSLSIELDYQYNLRGIQSIFPYEFRHCEAFKLLLEKNEEKNRSLKK